MPIATPSSASTTTTTAGQDAAGTLKLRGNHVAPTTSAYPDLDTKGYCVVKGAIPKERAAEYVSRMYQWLESFGKGFKADDKSTWHVENLPAFNRGGLFNRHGAGHEQFAWDIRSEPGLIDAFAKIWGTDQLLVSFDGVNMSLPFPAEEMGDRSAPWPHVDQSPNRRFKHCIQGIANLEVNGPNDGGLMVLENSLPLYNEFFDTHQDEMPEGGWTWRDSHHFTAKHVEWYKSKGCTWKKVEAEPGDVILWDSRCVHYGAHASGDRPRIATYVCYKPADAITPEKLELRKQCIANWDMTSHDPLMFHVTGAKGMGGKLSEDEQTQPKVLPVLSDRAKQLAGVLAY